MFSYIKSTNRIQDMKIILTGTQSTGKSTVLHKFEESYPVITEVVRNLAKTEGVNVNELGDEAGQRKIFDTYVRLLSETENYVSDRGLTDVHAYSRHHVLKGNLSMAEYKREMVSLKSLAERKDILWVYFPIEFPVVNDGFRSVNEDYRKEIDLYIQDILAAYNIPHITVHGTVEERVEQIKKAIKTFNK